MAESAQDIGPSILERRTLCMSGPEPGITLHHGERGFLQNVARHIPVAESNALEKMVELKAELRTLETESFWARLMEGITDLCHAQFGFVAKRILVDDHNSAIEMPPLGEPGSCLLGVAFYYNDGKEIRGMRRDFRYTAWGTGCNHMKHDKVFLIPEKLNEFLTLDPQTMPFAADAYLAVPLFADGKCFAHYGLMWTQEGLKARGITWGFTELIMHSFGDIIVERLVSGQGFAKPPIPLLQALTPPEPSLSKVIPRQAITATQSLKPYAKSLSHELRTPMQGVVGMLDVMHATVQEQIDAQSSKLIRQVFQTLRDNIEIVQDSSKRAVEAADNVVQAYDMNMQVPETPLPEQEPLSAATSMNYFDFKPTRVIEGSNIPANLHKRPRSEDYSWQFGNATKIRHIQPLNHPEVSPRTEFLFEPSPPHAPPHVTMPPSFPRTDTPPRSDLLANSETPNEMISDSESFSTPGLRHSHIRELIPLVINEALRVGGRPDSAISYPTDLGERIEIRSRSSNGDVAQKVIKWSVHESVPETIYVDERDLAKLISAVILNAIKFTEDGCIQITVRLSSSKRYLLISVVDTGDGIPAAFLPKLFKPFSRENDSLTRSKEGLGLGLLVAKGLARRLGGDISLLRSDIEGENKGSEFEIRIALDSEAGSSTFGTPESNTPQPSRSTPSTSIGPGSAPPTKIFEKEPEFPFPSLGVDRRVLSPANGSTSVDSDFSAMPAPRRTSLIPKLGASKDSYDKALAEKHPLTFLVAEDNKINRKLLVNMLGKFGYKDIYEAFDGKEAVRIMQALHPSKNKNKTGSAKAVDVILMDLWMPEMDGYQATEQILQMYKTAGQEANGEAKTPIILAVSADITAEAINRATQVGMEGFMTKPYKLMDLQRLIVEFCVRADTTTS